MRLTLAVPLLLSLTACTPRTPTATATETIEELTVMPRQVVEVTPEVRAKLNEIAFQAAREGDVQTLTDCLNAGVELNQQNGRGDTFLILSCYHGHEATTRLLLGRDGIDTEVRNQMGLTAMSGVAFKGHLALAKLLHAHGAQIDAGNARGQTPLMFAALTGRAPMIEFLLQHGANPAARDSAGRTPLDLARTQGAEDAVQLLEATLKGK